MCTSDHLRSALVAAVAHLRSKSGCRGVEGKNGCTWPWFRSLVCQACTREMVLSAEEFVSRRSKLKSYDDLTSLLNDSITQENEYRGLFSQQRDSWEVPEVLDPCLGLVDVYENVEAYQCLPQFTEDTVPRCFELKDKRLPVGTCTVWPKFNDFSTSWEVFSEGQLRYLDWSNVFAAGGSVAGCLAPVPAEYRDEQWGQDMKKRRTFFHDVGLPGDVRPCVREGVGCEHVFFCIFLLKH